MHALVTGAAGFLGRYIVEQLLARGDRVRALVRRPDAHLEQLGAELCFGDLTNPAALDKACQGVDTVFHVAARAGLGGPWKMYYEPNVLGTRYLLVAAKSNGASKFVFTSSPSVTFAGVDQRNVDEAAAPYPDHWLAHYPHSKALAEQEVLAANSPTLFTCALRPHLIWGPRDTHLIPKLIERARSGRLRQVGDRQNLIDTIFVTNAADAHLQAADALSPTSPVAGEAYFLSQGEPVNCWAWIDQLLGLAGLPSVHKSISFNAAWMLGSLCEGVWNLTRQTSDPPMTRFLAAQLATHHFFDISKARCDFGYAPQVSTEAGMRLLAAACQWPLK